MSRSSKCRRCGESCHLLVRKNVWVHDKAGSNHAPIPEST